MKNFNENWDGIPRKNETVDEAYIQNPTLPNIITYIERAIDGVKRFPSNKEIHVQDLKNILDALKKMKK